MDSIAEQTPKLRRGCLYYGCIAGLVLMLMMLVGGLLGLHYAKRMFHNFTDDKPMPLPQVQMSRADIDRIEQRIETFRQAVRSEKPTEPLILSADEINALIATDPDFRELKGKLYVTLSGDQVEGQLSIPMESVGLQLFKGRYLNGKGTFSVSLRNGRIRLNTMSFKVKDRPVPEVYMEQIRKQNLAESINNDPRAAAACNWNASCWSGTRSRCG